MKRLALCMVVALSACTYGVDRHGRPIDGFKPLTADTAPAPGPKPSLEIATRAIQDSLPERQRNIRIISVHEVFYLAPFGIPHSGWLHCFNSSGTNLFGQHFSVNMGYVIFQRDGQWRVVTNIRHPPGTCV